MALLTAEDVLNKAFSKTKYREGFDQDEVDDFLDEVANTIAALTAERDELQQRLGQAPAAGGEAPAQQSPSAAMGTASHSLLQAATDPNPPSATTMLAMAQKLHDEYVQAGEEARDRLIDEGKAKAESIVEQAEKDARGRMQDLDSERADLERRIDDLRRFERDYRGHLRNYLENLLGDLEHNASKASAGPVGSSTPEQVTSPGAAPTPQPAERWQALSTLEEAPSTPEETPSTPEETPSTPEEAPSTPEEVQSFDEARYAAPSPAPWGAPEPTDEGAPAAPQPPLGSFPEEDTEWGDSSSPQDDHNPFAVTEESESDSDWTTVANQRGFPAPPSDGDESGENPTEAPRWNF